MKDGNKAASICAIILLLVSIVETVVTAVFGFCEWYLAVAIEILFILGVCLVRFPYEIAYIRNTWHSHLYRESSDDDEPSMFAVQVIRFIGYFCMFGAVVVFLSFAIAY